MILNFLNSNLLLFCSYLLVFLCLLIPVFFLISIEVYKILKKIYALYLYYFISKYDLSLFNFSLFFKFYISSEQWFLCISCVELFYFLDIIDVNLFFLSLAYCYKKINYLKISEYYYLMALSNLPSNTMILKNLGSLYDKLGQRDQAIDMYRKVMQLNQEDFIPDFYRNLI